MSLPPVRRRRRIASPQPSRMFLFVVSALPPGEGDGAAPRPLIVYVTDPDPQQAAVTALAQLQAHGWANPDIQGAKEVSADPADEDEPFARETIERALQAGFAFIVYL